MAMTMTGLSLNDEHVVVMAGDEESFGGNNDGGSDDGLVLG